MRGLLFFAFVGLLAAGALPVFAQSGISVWPAKPTLRPNPVLLLEASASGSAELARLGQNYRLVLSSGTDEVGLRVLVRAINPDSGRQYLLQPDRLLTAGLTYRLVARRNDPSPGAAITPESSQYLSSLPKVSWLIQGAIDQQPPRWLSPAYPTGEAWRETTCGPQPHAFFWLSLQEDQPTIIELRLRQVGQATELVWFFPMKSSDYSQLGLPLATCGGPLRLALAQNFLLQCRALDASGNFSDAPGGTLLYRAPKVPPVNTLSAANGPHTGWYAQKPGYLLLAVGVVLFLYWLLRFLQLRPARARRSR